MFTNLAIQRGPHIAGHLRQWGAHWPHGSLRLCRLRAATGGSVTGAQRAAKPGRTMGDSTKSWKQYRMVPPVDRVAEKKLLNESSGLW